MRVFLAHPKRFSGEEIDWWKEEIEKQFRSEYPDVEVVPGRDDYMLHAPAMGTWMAWSQDVVERIDSSTREPWYDVFVVPGRLVGSATKLMIGYLLTMGRPVLIIEENQNDMGGRIEMQRVTGIRELDPKDYAEGWTLDT